MSEFFTCPSCHTRMQSPQSEGDDAVECPACGVPVYVLENDDDLEFVVDELDFLEDDPDFLEVETDVPAAPPQPERRGRKRCPFCAKWILTEAIKCRYCRSMLTGAAARVTPGTPFAFSAPVLPDTSYSHKAMAPILLSAVGNIVAGCIWLVYSPCFGLPCFVVSGLEFLYFSRRASYSLTDFRNVTLVAAIIEILAGVLNPLSFFCGVTVLFLRPARNSQPDAGA